MPLDTSGAQRSLDAAALVAPVLPSVDLGPLQLFNDAASRAAYTLDLLAFSTENLLTAGGFGAQPIGGMLLPAPLTTAPAAPPLGTGEEGAVATPSTFAIQNLTVVANDPDEMLAKIEERAKQKSRLGGVSGLDLAVAPVGQRGTPTGVR